MPDTVSVNAIVTRAPVGAGEGSGVGDVLGSPVPSSVGSCVGANVTDGCGVGNGVPSYPPIATAAQLLSVVPSPNWP